MIDDKMGKKTKYVSRERDKDTETETDGDKEGRRKEKQEKVKNWPKVIFRLTPIAV